MHKDEPCDTVGKFRVKIRIEGAATSPSILGAFSVASFLVQMDHLTLFCVFFQKSVDSSYGRRRPDRGLIRKIGNVKPGRDHGGTPR